MRRFVPLLLMAALFAAFAAGSAIRSDLGIEWSAESVRTAVQGLGLLAPLLFIVLVVFRSFLLLPSIVVLTAGGLAFGAPMGTLLGGVGILLSALMQFTVARYLGRDWIQARLGPKLVEFERRIEAAGPLVVGVSTAHPMGPMSPFHWGAGLSTIAWLPFAIAVAVSGPVRAGAYSFVGANIMEPGSTQFWLATGVLLVVAVVPLAHPEVRRRILAKPQ